MLQTCAAGTRAFVPHLHLRYILWKVIHHPRLSYSLDHVANPRCHRHRLHPRIMVHVQCTIHGGILEPVPAPRVSIATAPAPEKPPLFKVLNAGRRLLPSSARCSRPWSPCLTPSSGGWTGRWTRQARLRRAAMPGLLPPAFRCAGPEDDTGKGTMFTLVPRAVPANRLGLGRGGELPGSAPCGQRHWG